MKFILISLLIGICLTKTTVTWPSADRTVTVSEPIIVKAGEVFDGFLQNENKWTRYERGIDGLGDCKSIDSGRNDAVFILNKDATLKNVILGGKSIKHVYCAEEGCTVENVYWEDVCDDAVTIENGVDRNAKYHIKGGAARNAIGSIIQHNSAGTVYISDFYAENAGKLYRACGNCKKGYQAKRDAVLTNITTKDIMVLAGYNQNFGDTVTLKNVYTTNGHACRAFNGRNDGKEPTAIFYRCDIVRISSCVCQ